MEQRITEKKLKDKRFRKKERAILVAFFTLKGKLDLAILIKRAKISRSTFYRHHKNIYEIMLDYKKYILNKYKKNVGRLAGKNKVEVSSIYWCTLVFMFKNRLLLEMLIKHGEQGIIEKIIEEVGSKVLEIEKVDEKEMMVMYEKEVIGLIEVWGSEGFDGKKLDRTFDKIMFLTDNIKTRLGPIKKLG